MDIFSVNLVEIDLVVFSPASPALEIQKYIYTDKMKKRKKNFVDPRESQNRYFHKNLKINFYNQYTFSIPLFICEKRKAFKEVLRPFVNGKARTVLSPASQERVGFDRVTQTTTSRACLKVLE